MLSPHPGPLPVGEGIPGLVARDMPRLAVLAPHVVQYHAPVYRALAARDDVAIHVFYEARGGLDAYFMSDFGQSVRWDTDLTGGYPHSFLPNRGRAAWGGVMSRLNPGLLKILRRGDFEAVLIQGSSTLSDWLALLRAHIAGIRVLYRGEGVLEGRSSAPRWRDALKRFVMRRWLKRCDVVLYSCAGNRRYFEHYGVESARLRFMPCCVDNDYFQAQWDRFMPMREATRAELGLQPDDLAVGMFAKIISLKRPFDLLEAVARQTRSDIVAVFVGDGPERGALERRAEGLGVRAVFSGFVNQGELGKWYAAVDAAAVISDYDASPKAANEAMNFGLPIIATEVVGTAGDLLVDGDNAMLVPVGDIDAIADTLAKLNADRRCMAKMGERSRERVQSWSPERAAEAIARAVIGEGC